MQQTVESIAQYSKEDSEKYPVYEKNIARLAALLRPLFTSVLPDPATAGLGEARDLLSLAWKLRKAKEKDILELLRVLPMCIADLLNEYFENDHLKGVLAGEGILGNFYGPRSAGSVYLMLYWRMGRGDGSNQQWPLVRGGVGALTQA